MTKKWSDSAQLLGGTEIVLTGEHKYDHLHRVITELEDELSRLRGEMENLTKKKAELEARIKNEPK